MSKIKIFTDYKKISKRFYNSSLVIGNFDGVHRGHKKVIQLAKNISKKNQSQLGVMMFDPHPREYFSKEKRFLLSSLDNKYEILEKLGVDFIVILKFNKLLASMSALAFCNKILLNGCKMHHVFIGKNFRFGQNRVGNLKYLANFGKNNGFKVTGSELYKVNQSKKIFSSSSIREFIKKGKIKEANKFLGHAWSVSGRVITGDKRGRLIGFPTANLEIDEEYKLIPKNGVYLIYTKFEEQVFFGMMNIGVKPTLKFKKESIEVNLFDWEKDIYGEFIEVFFLDYIRDEKKFDSLIELTHQIKIDKKTCLKLIEEK